MQYLVADYIKEILNKDLFPDSEVELTDCWGDLQEVRFTVTSGRALRTAHINSSPVDGILITLVSLDGLAHCKVKSFTEANEILKREGY